jgi:hypothetical protein
MQEKRRWGFMRVLQRRGSSASAVSKCKWVKHRAGEGAAVLNRVYFAGRDPVAFGVQPKWRQLSPRCLSILAVVYSYCAGCGVRNGARCLCGMISTEYLTMFATNDDAVTSWLPYALVTHTQSLRTYVGVQSPGNSGLVAHMLSPTACSQIVDNVSHGKVIRSRRPVVTAGSSGHRLKRSFKCIAA